MIDLAQTARFVARWEGFYGRPYRNFAGEPWTVGYGETDPAFVDRFWPPAPVCTEPEAMEQMKRSVAEFALQVVGMVRAGSKNEHGAMTSLAYNIGIGGFQGSTVRRKYNAGDTQGAAAAFGMWNKVNGQPVEGLTRRRKDEAEWFLTPDAPPEERKEIMGENLTVVRSGLVLDAAGWGTANGTLSSSGGSRGQKNQQVIFTPNPHHGGHWISFAHAPGLVFDQVPTEERKHELHLWGRSEAKWQAWAFEGVGDESDAWRLRNLWSDMVVDIADMSKEPGARAQMWDWHGRGNQRFVLSRFR